MRIRSPALPIRRPGEVFFLHPMHIKHSKVNCNDHRTATERAHRRRLLRVTVNKDAKLAQIRLSMMILSADRASECPSEAISCLWVPSGPNTGTFISLTDISRVFRLVLCPILGRSLSDEERRRNCDFIGSYRQPALTKEHSWFRWFKALKPSPSNGSDRINLFRWVDLQDIIERTVQEYVSRMEEPEPRYQPCAWVLTSGLLCRVTVF